MAIIYSYPEIPDVQGGDLLLISDTGAPNKPTRSVDIDDLAAYIGTVVGVVQNLQSVLTVGNTYVSPDGHGTFTLNDITNNDGSITFVNADEGWGYQISAEEGINITDGNGNNLMSVYSSGLSITDGNRTMNVGTNALTATRNVYFPDASGTLALTSDIGGPYLPLTGGTLSGNLAIIKSQPTLTLVDGTKVSYLQNINGSLYYSAWLGDNIFQSNSGQTMVIKQNGNVGIGTTNPTNRLHVENGITKLDSKSFTSLPLGLYSSNTLTGMAIFADDPIANSGQINIDSTGSSGNNEVGMNFATGGFSSSNVKLSILNTGQLKAHSYGSGSFTGTATQRLAVDTNGNVIEIPIGSGPVDGSGTANYLTKWIDSDTIGNSIAYDSGSQLLLNATSAAFGAKLYINGDSYVTGGYQVGTANTYVGKLVNSSGVLTLESDSRDIQFKSSANVFMYIDDDGIGGKVGIGTTSPTQKVVIKKSSFGSVNIGATVASGATLLAAGGNTDYGTFFATQHSSDNYTGLIQQRRQSAATFYNLALNPYGGNVGIGTTSPSAKLDISTTGTGDSMIIRNNDASSSAAPVLMLLRDSASAANGDYLGQIKFKGNSDTGAERVYAKVTAKISDATNGAEDSLIETAVRNNGANIIVSRQTNTDLKLINGVGLEVDGDVQFGAYGAGTLITDANGNVSVSSGGGAGGPYLPLAGGTMTGAFYAEGALPTTPGMSGTGIGLGQASNYAHAQFSGSAGGYIDFSEPNVDWSGRIIYTHSSDSMVFYTAATAVLTLDSSNNATFAGNVQANSYKIGGVTVLQGTSTVTVGSGGGTGKVQLNTTSGVGLILDGSNVGIGTTSPSQKLEVAGNIRTTGAITVGTTAGSDINMLRTSANYISATNNTGYLVFRTGGYDAALTLDASQRAIFAGNVTLSGTGTDNDSHTLAFVNGACAIARDNNDLDLHAYNAIVFGVSNTSYPSSEERMRITSSGNVGIGTTNPVEKLHVNSGSANEVARFESTDGTAYLSIMDNNTSNSLQGIGSTGNNLTFYSNNAERMRIADSGNVGIGDTNPTMRLKVVDSTAGVLAAFTNSSSSGAGIQITAGNGTNNSLQIRNYAGGELMRVQGNGRVGIGTTTPGAKLSVNGNVKIEGTNSLLFGGSATIPNWEVKPSGSDLVINDTGSNVGSVLFNNDKGVALPRLTTTQINAISSPIQGLMAYNTTLNTICFYNGSSWQKVSHANM